MKWGLKPKLILACVLLAACAFAGGAWAASGQTTASPSRRAFISDVAKRLGTTPQKLNSALQGAYFDQLNAAVKASRLTRAQANAIEHATRRRGLGPLAPLLLAPGPPAPGKGPWRLAPRWLPKHGPNVPPAPRWKPPSPGQALPPVPAPPPPTGS